MTKKILSVNSIARVEGEGALELSIENNKVQSVKLKIFEPPRFFESLLRGRSFSEAPDITSRICGICPIAYLLGSSLAMEDICDVGVSTVIKELRRLIYCGEWIKSHAIHMFLLQLPDFLGFADAVSMAKDHGDIVAQGLRIKKIGNQLMSVVGGRDIHPINLKVGGFYSLPKLEHFMALKSELEWALKGSIELMDFLQTLKYPNFEEDYEVIALVHDQEYPFNEGRLVSNKGINVAVRDLDSILTETHVEHSTALHCYLKNRGPCLTGPMARFILNYDKLSPLAKKAAQKAKLDVDIRNPYKMIMLRGVEVIFALEEALRIINNQAIIKTLEPVYIDVKPKNGTGYGCTEAPRGICYHRYSIDQQGNITDAKIIAPTTINQTTIETGLYQVVQQNINLNDDELKAMCENYIRNYDPCISCSTHFLKLTVNRA